MQAIKSLKDTPGTQREYETIFILRGDTPNDGVGTVNSRVKGIVDHMGGKVLKVDNWGKRKLAYEVQKQLKGIYLYWRYLGSSGVVEEIERNLRMLDTVIRYYTVKVDEDVDPAARPQTVDEETFNKVASIVLDEEELVIGAVSMLRFDDDELADLDDEFFLVFDDDILFKALKDKD